MLPKEENELLTRVGPNTPMGDFLREYWLPLMPSDRLGEPDGRPQRARLLCEDLIAFRDSEGRPGLLANNCAHRGASLFFGRNEEEGLRCVYHGWKFDVAGRCVDMPNEPAESNFKDKVRQTAYPCEERNGIVWTYMGPRTTPPPLPNFEFLTVPLEQVHSFEIMWRHCNWLQALEGCLDSSHVYFLHSRLRPEVDPSLGVYHPDKHPRFEVVSRDWGLMYGARREEDAEHYYWRVTQYLLPYTLLFPSFAFWRGAIPGHMWIPVDDYNVLNWTFRYEASPLFSPEERRQGLGSLLNSRYLPETTQPFGWTRPVGRLENDFLLDPEVQRTQTYTGIPGALLQDQAVTETMGPILDRTIEHLGTSDLAVIQFRQLLLKLLRAYKQEGVMPPGVDDPELYRKRSASVILPKSEDWVASTDAWVNARPGAEMGVLGY